MGVEFDIDPASPGADIVPWIPAKQHLTRAEDGLTTPWQGFVWCNPPYGVRNGMQKWIDKFVTHGNGVILLPPISTRSGLIISSARRISSCFHCSN